MLIYICMCVTLMIRMCAICVSLCICVYVFVRVIPNQSTSKSYVVCAKPSVKLKPYSAIKAQLVEFHNYKEDIIQ